MPPLLYAVWCDVDPSVEKEWESWMKKVHVPEVVAAGSFVRAKMYASRDGGVAKRVTIYEAKDQRALDAYLEGPAKRLREDYQKHFGVKSKLTRMILEETFST